MATQERREITLGGPLYVEPSSPGPLEAESIFGRSAPLVIDIGAARARYFLNVAPAMPEVNFLGIEVKKIRVEAALERLAKHGLTNCRMMHGNAIALITDHIAPASVTAITVMFPDPWPKKRHAKRRLFHQPAVAQLLASRLQPGGLLLFKSDNRGYFEEAVHCFAADPELTPCKDLTARVEGVAPVDLDRPEESYYETKWREEGRDSFVQGFRCSRRGSE
ncbi:MAG: tRNA (guanosine(46)-N7)-methyltransferase TrmB [Planctomycetota bacterium]